MKILLRILFVAFAVALSSCSNAPSTENAKSSSVVTLLDGVTASWDGADLIDYPTGKPSITMLKITVPPYSKLPLHYHPVINVGYMLEGSLTVTDNNGNSKTINAGEVGSEITVKDDKVSK